MTQSLHWKTYKSVGPGAVPVAEIQANRRYSFELAGQGEDHPVSVPAYERAWMPEAGRELGAGDSVSASALADGPVLIYPTETPNRPELLKLSRQKPRTSSAYWRPEFLEGDEDVLSPEYRKSRSGVLYAEASALGRGVYELPPGYRQIVGIKVQEDLPLGRTSYAPRHGALYLEGEDGAPVRGARVEVFLGRGSVMRRDVSRLPAGRHPIAPGEPVRGFLEIETGRALSDARRLPAPEAKDKWHALDYGQTDGSPIAPASMWVIKTDADAGDVQEAVRRTLPAGSIYRIERP